MNKNIDLKFLFDFIEKELLKKDRVIISLDGNACGGKTTLSEMLKNKYGATIIHIDDFYKPRDKEKGIDLLAKEGNINYERFYDEIISQLNEEKITYKKFNCTLQKEENPIIVRLNKLIVVEGTYSQNPRLHRYFDASIFVKISDDTQIERLKKRNPNNYDSFIKTWVKLERNYFNEFDIKNRSDFILDGTNLIQSEGSN